MFSQERPIMFPIERNTPVVFAKNTLFIQNTVFAKKHRLKRNLRSEHRVRTRRLIQKGAVLESVDPNLAQLNEEQLKACLREIFSNHTVQEVAKNHLLSQQEVDTP